MSKETDARQIVAIVSTADGGGVPRDELEQACNWTEKRFMDALFCAYYARKVDFIRDYVVQSGRPVDLSSGYQNKPRLAVVRPGN